MVRLTTHFPSRLRQTRDLSVAHIAGMLEERLYDPRLSADDVVEGCRRARENQLAAVVCQPSGVALAAKALAGSPVQVAVTATFDLAPSQVTSLPDVLRATECLLKDGARVVGPVVGPERLQPRARTALATEIQAVADLVTAVGGHVRVLLSTGRMTRSELVIGCQVSVDSGASMVQGGTRFDDDRASLSQVALMRQALGKAPLLKWTAPVASLDRLLLACAEGVDRFNGDTTVILQQAARRRDLAELRIPIRGIEY